jgi:CPA1 family monovalent cation:H+ antiporter
MDHFQIAAILISLAAGASYINVRFIRLPNTIGVMLIALAMSLGLIALGKIGGQAFGHYAATIVGSIDFERAILHVMLAYLLFAAALHLNLNDVVWDWGSISLLSLLGTILSTFLVGLLLYWAFGWIGLGGIGFKPCLLFGALISPTDPIAVIGIMRAVGVPKRMETQMAGESLFNDGIGVVIFLVMLKLCTGDGAPSGWAVASMLVTQAIGGAAFGLVVGVITYQFLKRVDNYTVEVMLTLALATAGYACAEALHVSAPIAIVVAGLLIGNHGRAFAMSAKTREHLDSFWELIDETLNAVLFLLIGLELLVMPIHWRYLGAGIAAIVVTLLARWASVGGILSVMRPSHPFSSGTIPVLTWGGLRGGISVAMALSLPKELEYRTLLVMATYCVVVFSVTVQGLTIASLLRRLGLTATAKHVESGASPSTSKNR